MSTRFQGFRERLYGSCLFFSARLLHQFVFDRQALSARREMRRFYSRFIHSGDLVFDIGANVGEYSEVFSSLGARVVAVEPNPLCCAKLYRLARMRDVRVEAAAVADAPGCATLKTCDISCFSTCCDEWWERPKACPEYRDVKWLEPLEVPVITLDSLAKRHGTPRFLEGRCGGL